MYLNRHTTSLLLLLALTPMVGCGGAEQRRTKYLERGEGYFVAGNFEKARVEFRNALQIDPKDAQAHYQAGRAAEKLGDPRAAAGHYQAAIDNNAAHHDARAALARLFLFGGAPQRALDLAQEGLKLEPQSAPLLTARGAARSQLGDVPGAFEDAEASLKLNPADEYTVALLSSLYRQNARSDRAIEVVQTGLQHLPQSTDLRVILAELELAHERPEQAEAQMKKVVELAPADLTHRYRLARFYILQKNLDAAEAVLRDAVSIEAEEVDPKLALAQFLATHRNLERAEAELRRFADAEVGNAELQLALGRFHESHHQTDKAAPVYRELIEREGTRPIGLAARNRLAALEIQAGRTAEAEKLIAAVLQENARDNDALALRGNLALAKGDAAGAITDLRSVLRDQPNSPVIKRALARAHLQNNELALAEEMLKSAMENAPADVGVRQDLARLLTQTGRAQQAVTLLEQVADEAREDVAVYEHLFRAQVAAKDVAGARRTADRVERLWPNRPLGAYLVGTVAEADRRYADAQQAYERSLKIQPDGAEPLGALVRLHVMQKQPERALESIDASLAHKPHNVIALNLKGEILASQGKFEAAKTTFDEVLAGAPKWWVPYRGLALAQIAQKDTAAAVATLERGLAATDHSAPLATDLSALYERLGKPEEAIRVYEGLVNKDPKLAAAANNLAMLLASYRSDGESLNKADELTKSIVASGEPAFLNTRGWVKYKQGQYSEAVRLLQEALQRNARPSPAMEYHLGMAQLKAGNRAEAVRHLTSAVSSGAKFVGDEEARQTLERLTPAG